MEMYNDAFWRWKELRRHSGCLSDLLPGHPESSGSAGFGAGTGQRSTTAKRLTYWLKRHLRSPTFEVRKHSMSPELWVLLRSSGGATCSLHRQQAKHSEPSGSPDGTVVCQMTLKRPRVVSSGGWWASIKKAPETPPWFMGTPRLCLCGRSSAEQILQTAHSPTAPFSPPAHCLCPRISFRPGCGWGGGGWCSQSHWANRAERSLPSLPCSQENLSLFIFFTWAPSCRAEPRVWCQKAELIALSQRGPATHHQTSPEMFYWRLLQLSHYTRCTNIGPQRQSSSALAPLFMVLNHSREKWRLFSRLSLDSFDGLCRRVILSFVQRESGKRETDGTWPHQRRQPVYMHAHTHL